MRRVKGFVRGRSEVWVWQVKGLGVAGRGQALTFPSNMASEEPGRETSQDYTHQNDGIEAR